MVSRSVLASFSAWLALAGCVADVGSSTDLATAKRPASRVELKVTVREDQVSIARDELGLDDASSARRAVTFYDTPSLDLYAAGAILRARDADGGEDDDSTVKVRPLSAKDVDLDWFAEDGFKCEIDRTTQKSVSSCSLSEPESGEEIRAVASGDRPVKKLFSDAQEAFLSEHVEDVSWDALRPLGPIDARVWSVALDGLPDDVDAELWTLPDGRELLELSIKVKASEADDTQAALGAALAELGLDASATQETKTKAALDYFAAH